MQQIHLILETDPIGHGGVQPGPSGAWSPVPEKAQEQNNRTHRSGNGGCPNVPGGVASTIGSTGNESPATNARPPPQPGSVLPGRGGLALAAAAHVVVALPGRHPCS